ncbi:hypothetical protein F5144DRAFT_499238 [Chaetomium tenue]|uniref:Uncharacterized protein n=1 Tax=Chaetomium tenue TaxID=1854479 RepID=A0ACB7NVJ4_9PEZI|nr:hypothetical protein F5144DRAFT_499238 [Chaetomium globosum]
MPQQRLRRQGKKIESYNETTMAQRAWARSQPGQKTRTKAKLQRRKAGAALPPSAVLASSQKPGVALYPTTVAAPSPNNLLPSDVPPTRDVTAVAPHGTNLSFSPSGGAAVSLVNSITPSSPMGTVAATLETSRENDQAAEKTSKGQTCSIVLQTYGGQATIAGARRAWERLASDVEEFSRLHFVDIIDWDTLDANKKEKLAAWAPWAEEYFACYHQSRSKLRRLRSPRPQIFYV